MNTSLPDNTDRPTVATIDLDALSENLNALKDWCSSATIMGIVKANAYGHGLVACARHLESAGISSLGVGFLEEGVALRRAGLRVPILVLGGICETQLPVFLEHDLSVTASSPGKLQAIDAAAVAAGRRASVHLKIDTGMHRIGVRPSSVPALLEVAERTAACDIVGAFSHFATADEVDLATAQRQLEAFLSVADDIRSACGSLSLHMANSAALLHLPESHLDMVRPGIALYGVPPAVRFAMPLELKPVLSWTTRVVFFKVIPAGAGVSYGHRWHAPAQTRLVTLPLGYGDGYVRRYSNAASVLIRGKRYPVVGSVCMDQCMVAIGDDEAFNGDEVVLIGSDGQERITVGELAGLSDTVPHEVCTLIGNRVPRVYQRDGKRYSEQTFLSL